MLTIPIDRITLLLEQATLVWNTPENGTSEHEPPTGSPDASADSGDPFSVMPAFSDLSATLRQLSPDELHELLAVALIGENDHAEHAEDDWDTALQRAQSVATEEALTDLARILVLTDAIESGLDRLGYLWVEELITDDADDEEGWEEEQDDNEDENNERDEEDRQEEEYEEEDEENSEKQGRHDSDM